MTIATSKQLLPGHDKPMVYYPLSTLMLAGIRDVLVITTPEDSAAFQRLLGAGGRIGCRSPAGSDPEPRGELEITEVNGAYLRRGRPTVTVLERGTAGHRHLQVDGCCVRVRPGDRGAAGLQDRVHREIAWSNGWIDDEEMDAVATPLPKSGYGEYLRRLVGGPSQVGP